MPPRVPCGNPLFLKWVEELRDQARERGSKAMESYCKAAKSIALCPVTYDRPRDLIVLAGVGAKTVSILEGKWKKHCADNGLPSPGSPEKRPGSAKSKSKIPKFDFDSDEGTGSEAEAGPSTAPPAKKRKATKPKTYIPAKGSGGYGILLGLVCSIRDPTKETQVFLTKSELVRAAQPYSESSYDHAEKGTYFTAWNSMKTLVGKGYVYVTGNPHKYCLTEEGYDVACAIRTLLPEFAHVPKYPFLHDPVDTSSQPPRSSIVPSTRSILPSPPATLTESVVPCRKTSAGKFQFWYIDSSNTRVERSTMAMVRLGSEDFTPLRKVEFLESQRLHPFVSSLRLVDKGPIWRYGQMTLYGFVEEETAPPLCSKFDADSAGPSGIAKPQSHQTQVSRIPTPISDDEDFVVLPSKPFSRSVTVPPTHGSPQAESSVNQVSALIVNATLRRLDKGKSIDSQSSASSSSNAVLRRPLPRLSSHIQPVHPLAEPVKTIDPSSLPDFDPSKAITLPAGSYEIVLILDTREVESRNNRDKISEKLLGKGVNVETRALRLGDVCWIARRLDGLGGEEDECVLDYVLERKRLDDLCASIRDGRYLDQCFRLSNSGISNVFYLVEDWQTSHLMEFSGQQIMTAKSQIQVHNRFILKETHKLSESIDYLATMTRVIQKRLRDADLKVIPTRYLSRSTYLHLRQHLSTLEPETTWHTSFEAYQDLNDKSASATVRDKWARMLLCIKGMSAERVSAFIEEFETPRSMWEALKEHIKEAQRRDVGADPVVEQGTKSKGKGKSKERGVEMFFADRIKGEGRRKIGDALSRELFKMFMGSLEGEE